MDNCVVENSEKTSGLCDKFEMGTHYGKNKDLNNVCKQSMNSCKRIIGEQIPVECINNTRSEKVANIQQTEILQEDIENLDIPRHKKIDAFQYMMCNRHKRIGTNSPGKEIDLNTHEGSNSRKQTCQARRQLLEKWAEQKGASKRKREYEEQGLYVKHKLEKRARKLKKMITALSDSDEELIIKKRTCVITDSDDENPGLMKEMNKDTLYETKAKSEKIIKNRGKPTKKQRLSLIGKKNANNVEFRDRILKIDKNLTEANSLEKQNNESNTGENENVYKSKNNYNNSVNSDCETMMLRSRKGELKLLGGNIGCFSDDQYESDKKHITKVAPVFLKVAAANPEVIEARKQFLLSGVPDSLKKEMEKPQSIDDWDFDVFPALSHIQQKTPHRFWSLPKIDIEHLIDHEPLKNHILEVSISSLLTKDFVMYQKQENPNLNILKGCKDIIKFIKSENQNYPVHRVYKSLYNKSGHKTKCSLGNNTNTTKDTSSRNTPGCRKQNKKNYSSKSTETTEVTLSSTEENLDGYAMWTEKYGFNNLENIVENSRSISLLKEWIMAFIENKKCNYDSESEFEPTDSDSRDSMNLHSNTILLNGPHGSGKTSAVYAICDEFGLNVLEVNASSKRTGKWLLQELQEATQSHQVRRKKNLLSVFRDQKEKSTAQKICVLLIEDVDVVFEQDEGFIAALMQIISTSKRPIILTTTDENVAFLHKIINNYKVLHFSPFLSRSSSIWLQLVCLIEGCHVNLNSLENLLNYNRGDIRKTLLHLQYWVTSEKKILEDRMGLVSDNLLTYSENLNTSDIKLEKSIKCITDVDPNYFERLENYGYFCLPHNVNLEIIFWNLSTILNVPNFSNFRLNYHDNENICTLEVERTKERQQLNTLSKLYDSLAFIDIICNRNKFLKSLERTWRIKPKDALGLNERVSDYNDEDFINNLSNTLLGGQMKTYKEKFQAIHSNLNVAVPSVQEARWYSKQLCCEEKLNDALLNLNCLERRSRALDYMPTLRSILKFEIQNTINGTTRRRFYSYLRQLDIYNGESIYKTASNIFKSEI